MSGLPQGSTRWDLIALSKNSPALAEIAGASRLKVGDYVETIQLAVVTGVEMLSDRPQKPEYFSYSALTKVRRMAVQARRLDTLTVFAGEHRAVIDQRVSNNIDFLIGSGSVSLGDRKSVV